MHFDTIDLSKAWFQSRYDKGETEAERTAYLNCPMDRDQYEAFIDALLAAEKTEFKDWERDTPYFEGCLPIEVMAERGRDTLRFGPLKPVGLTNPHAPDTKPHAVVQLRRDNALGTLYNLVGFQTKMKHGAQTEVFRTIPGLENASFARLGGIHRNTFLNSPRLLDAEMRLKAQPRLRFAGQITGVEGYVESAAMGLVAGRLAAAERVRLPLAPPPATTAMGALLRHITGGADARTFQPMNVNFGLFPPLDDARTGRRGRRDRYRAYTDRAKADFTAWLTPTPGPRLRGAGNGSCPPAAQRPLCANSSHRCIVGKSERPPPAPSARCATKCCAGTVSPIFTLFDKYISKYTSRDISSRVLAPDHTVLRLCSERPATTKPGVATDTACRRGKLPILSIGRKPLHSAGCVQVFRARHPANHHSVLCRSPVVRRTTQPTKLWIFLPISSSTRRK